ncbi:hypothetical protein [Ornithinimicrobium sufpigmenti]|uniref:hypothetical protein n=1 Tax=Ornithinimicrobium sufpigmenti TaxID=2508882 RepID=UPI0015E1A10E|nr:MULTISPECIES: hypothetical protein [unclassified Ornithinimicrobium]
MTDDPRAALSALVAALETHLETAAVRRGDNDPSVLAAYDRIIEAFSAYDDALMDAYGEVTPLVVYGEDEEGAGDDELDDEDDLDGDDEDDLDDDEDEFDTDDDDDEDDEDEDDDDDEDFDDDDYDEDDEDSDDGDDVAGSARG